MASYNSQQQLQPAIGKAPAHDYGECTNRGASP